MMNLALAMDVVMISLLVLTIWFCWRLQSKIIAFKESRQDLSEMVKTFDSAIIKTHKNVAELKAMSNSSSQELQLCINKAGELIEDLSFMTEAAGKLADRLEMGIAAARSGTGKTATARGQDARPEVRKAPAHTAPVQGPAQASPTPARAPAPHPLSSKPVQQKTAANDVAGTGHNPFTKSSQELRNAIRDLKKHEG